MSDFPDPYKPSSSRMPPQGSYPPEKRSRMDLAQMSIKEENVVDLQMPEKTPRTGQIKNAARVEVETNCYELQISGKVPMVFKHELVFEKTSKKGTVKKLTQGPKNDVANNLRHELLYECAIQMIERHPNDFGFHRREDLNMFAYDCGVNFYSAQKLMEPNEEKQFNITLADLSEKSLGYLGNNVESIKGTLVATIVIDLRSKDVISSDITDRNREVNQFLEILSSQQIYQGEKYFIFAQKMFEKRDQIPLQQNPHILKSGMSKSVRCVGDSEDRAQMVVQIDPKKSAFYPDNMPIIQYLCQRLDDRREQCRDGRDLESVLTSNDRKRRAVVEILKGLSAVTTHLANNTFFTIDGLTAEGADEVMFTTNDGRISVQDYYYRKKNLRLRYPKMPCAKERRLMNGKVGYNFYPLELLNIHEGQRVPRTKMSTDLAALMTRQCQIKPIDYGRECAKQLDKADLGRHNPVLNAFGAKVESRPIRTDAEVLHPPAIQYGNCQTVELPQHGRFGKDVAWQLREKQTTFIEPAKIPQDFIWVFMRFQRCVEDKEANTFVREYGTKAYEFGLMLPDKPKLVYVDADAREIDDSTDRNGRPIKGIRSHFKMFEKNKVKFVLFTSEDATHPVHHYMKLMETEFNIVTQHVVKKTLIDALGQKMTYRNLVMKTNQKLGGINWDLGTSKQFQEANRMQENVVRNIWLKTNRMFFGIDMSHAEPQSLHDRQKGTATQEPTSVGLAFTLGHPLNIRAEKWYQQPRLTIIQDLVKQVQTALTKFMIAQKRLPSQVYVYRAGVSDGEYAKVKGQEKVLFDQAFEKVYPKGQKPELVIILVQKNSDYRIIPTKINLQDKPTQQNVPPGTVVDQKILHPTQEEFLIQPHKALQGTGRPIKGVVIHDDCTPRISREEHINVFNCLCYGHGIVTTPTSVPNVLYSAGDIAKRGRNDWKHSQNVDDSVSVASGSSGGVRGQQEVDPEHYANLTNQLKRNIDTKYFA